jgi:hypothetical protein
MEVPLVLRESLTMSELIPADADVTDVSSSPEFYRPARLSGSFSLRRGFCIPNLP